MSPEMTKPYTNSSHDLHRGVSTLEVLVALTLLCSVLTASVPLVVRHGRLLSMHRHYRMALDELSNQLERLSALPETELQPALERLTPSEFTAKRLHGVELHGRLEPADIGQRLTLQISWDELQRRESPITMSAWILPTADPSRPRR